MQLCENCKQRPAVVFVTKVENGNKTTSGLCLGCAKKLGFPLDQAMGGMMEQLGMTPEQLENAEEELAQVLPDLSNDPTGENTFPGGALPVDFSKIFGNPKLFGGSPKQGNVKTDGKAETKADKKLKYLPQFAKNLTEQARTGHLDRIVGRDAELSRMIQILCRRQKNNPCLIGEPGVGKTAIAEALAIRIAEKKVPYKLVNKEIYLLDMTAVVAGTQFRGQFEGRMQGLLNEVRTCGNIILVIDEVHNIVGAGDSEGSMNAANILKPALSRGEVQIIGATTLNEYRKYIEKDTALERRFQPVIVNEPSLDDTVEMLRGIKHYYEEFHGITVPEDLLRKIVVMSERYITDRYLPDKAIDLLDEAASATSLSCTAINESLEIRDKLLSLKEKRETLENQVGGDEKETQNRYEEITQIRSEEMALSNRLSEIQPETEKVTLTAESVAAVIELWTGIPATSITENESDKIIHLKERLKQHIIGQDEAVELVSKGILRSRAGLSLKKKPVSFIFAGPTGVGKTELVKQLAMDLFHSPETLIRLDMSEFMEKHSVSRIIGAPPGYVGYDEAGQLTEKIRRHPYSVVLFDEIEKAHPDVLNILLQILDDGRVTDARGKTVNFENTVIVMTTNAGSDHVSAPAGFLDSGEQAKGKTQKALEGFLRPEFINRVDNIITFRSLDEADFVRIADLRMKELAQGVAEKGIALTYTDEVLSFIAKNSYSRQYGARNMRRFIEDKIENPLSEVIVADFGHQITQIKLVMKDGEITVLSL